MRRTGPPISVYGNEFIDTAIGTMDMVMSSISNIRMYDLTNVFNKFILYDKLQNEFTLTNSEYLITFMLSVEIYTIGTSNDPSLIDDMNVFGSEVLLDELCMEHTRFNKKFSTENITRISRISYEYLANELRILDPSVNQDGTVYIPLSWITETDTDNNVTFLNYHIGDI